MSSVHTRYCFLVVGFLVALTSFAGYAHAQPGPEQLTILEVPVLFVDPATNTASVYIRLINRSSQPITKISLSAGPFKSETSGKDIGAKATFAGPTDTAGKATYELASLAPQVMHSVRIDISGIWEAGESAASLYNNGNEIGKLRAVKYLPPFAVRVVGPAATSDSPNNVEIEFEEGRTSQILLKNDDAMTYPVRWDFNLGNKTISSEKSVIISPKSTVAITIDPPKDWFPTATGLFKDEVKDGTLTLSLRPPLSVDYPLLPQQILPIKARLRSVSQTTQSVIALVFALIALTVGAFCSLLLRDFMPNRLQRIKLEGKLDEVAGNLQDLNRLKDPSLTVPVSVERNRLLKNLKAPRFFSPEIATIFAECQEGIETLERRIAVLEEVARAWELLYEKQQSVAPSLILRARDTIKEASSLLRRSHPRERNLDEPKAHLAAARQILESTGANPEFVKELANRIKELQTIFSTAVINSGTYADFRPQLTTFLPALDNQNADETKIQPSDYFRLDMHSSLLLLIKDYVSFLKRSGAAADSAAKTKQAECAEPFLQSLDMQTFEGFRDASIIVNEMRQNIFAGSLTCALLTDPSAISIHLDKPEIRSNQAIQLTARFHQPGLNKAAARETINCFWQFIHEGESGGSGQKGWVMWHYFPKASKCTAIISFVDEGTGQSIVREDGKPVIVEHTFEVLPEVPGSLGDRFKIEATTFVIALGVAMLGLVLGAREQLVKLDLVAGFVAVFLIGFSADTVKNLLTQPSREKTVEQLGAAPQALSLAPKPDSASLVVKTS